MKIAFVYDVIYPYVKGGAERRYYELARRLNGEHEIHLWGMKFWDGPDVIRTEQGITLHGVCPPKELYVDGRRSISQAVYYSLRLFRPLLKVDFDLVVCSNIPFFPVFTCKIYALLKRKPLLVTWHEYWGNYWYQYLESWPKGFVAKTIEWLAARLPDRIVAVSEHTKTALVGHGVSPDEIEVVHNGINLAEIQSVSISAKKSDVIFVGRLIKEKNVDLLLQVIKRLKQRLPGIKCLIIGDGPERERLEQLNCQLGLEENIEFLGALDNHADVYSYMKASKIFVLLSEREGFGIVVPEANACGLPVVVAQTKHSAAYSLVSEGRSGFVVSLKLLEKIEDRLYHLLSENATRVKIAQMATNWAQQFDWSVSTQQTEQLYHQLTENHQMKRFALYNSTRTKDS